MFFIRLESIWQGLRRRLSGGQITIVGLQQQLTLIFIASLLRNNIHSGVAFNGCCTTSDKSYEWLLSGFIFSCFLVNITKPDVIIHLAVLLVNHLLIHKPVKQYITHWIICEDFLAQVLALNSVFQGIPTESELSSLFLDQSCFLAVCTAVGL